MKTHEKISVVQRLAIQGVRNDQLSKGFDVSKRTVQRWKVGDSEDKTRVSKLQHGHLNWLKSFVLRQPQLTQLQYCEHLYHKFALKISQPSMYRALCQLGITRKVMTKIPAKGDIAEQDRFVQWYRNHSQHHHVAIDEAAIVMPFSPKYGYALRNQRAPLCADSLSRKRMSLIVAMSSQHCQPIYRLLDVNINSSQVQEFIKSLPPDWQQATIIADNASVHKCLIKTWPNVKYLPVYSPQLNPVELYFQTIKGRLRKSSARSADVVQQILQAVSEKVSSPACFKHCLQDDKTRVRCPAKP